MSKKIAFMCLPGLNNFISPVAKKLEEAGFEIKECYDADSNKMIEYLEWCDIVWIEWANQMAIHLTTDPILSKIIKDKKVVCRMHSYEALVPEFIKEINWKLIDNVIFIALHIYDISRNVFKSGTFYGINEDKKRCHIISNGVDLNKFRFIPHDHGNNIGNAGYINHKKGPMLLLHAFQQLHSKNNNLKLNIVGTFQEPRYYIYYNQMIRTMNLNHSINYAEWQEHMHLFYEQQNYMICSSVLESQCMVICESMAMGVKPLIHNFVGAEDIYPKEWIWNTIDDLHSLIEQKYDSERYRQYIIDNYNLEDKIKQIINLLERI